MGKKDVFLTPVGSAGDVHPFLALGRELSRRGHRVTVVVNPYFEASVRRLGLGFAPLGTQEDFLNVLHHPDLWHPTRALPFILTRGALPVLRPLYDILRERADPGRSLVAGSALAFGARVAQEKWGLPMASVHLQPSIFLSARRPAAPLPSWLPAFAARGVYRLLDAAVDRAVGPALNGFRAELGLPPAARIMGRWWHSPDRIICLFPEWFAPAAPDWPPRTAFAGFPLFDDDDGAALDPGLDAFLAAGDAPLVFMAGSANAQAAGYFRTSLDVCRRLGRRGLLLSRFPEQMPEGLPPSVRYAPYVPLGRLLPRVAALVHHGGIGTTAQGLAAGVPQLIRPLAYDQFDNARRVRRLGAGDALSPQRYTGPRAARVLGRLLDQDASQSAARAAAKRISGADAVARACDLLVATGGRP